MKLAPSLLGVGGTVCWGLDGVDDHGFNAAPNTVPEFVAHAKEQDWLYVARAA